MLALYRSGRQVEANERFQAYRLRIDEESGLLPGRDLQGSIAQCSAMTPGCSRRPTTGAGYADRYSQVVRALFAARLVPVVGPLAGNASPVAAAPARAAVAAHLARVFQYPNDCPGGLYARFALRRRYARRGRAVRRTSRAVRGRLRTRPGPPRTCRPAAVLRPRGLPLQLVVTSGSTERSNGRSPTKAKSSTSSRTSRSAAIGQFLHVAPDGTIRVIDEPNVEVGLTTEERTIILKIHGGTVGSLQGTRGTYVVSEDDYIDYLSSTPLSALLPVGLAARLSRSAFLFFGTSSTTGACASSCAGYGERSGSASGRGRWARRIHSPPIWNRAASTPSTCRSRSTSPGYSVTSRPN